MAIDPTNLQQRTVIIGRLIQEARQKANHTIEECAEAAGVSADQFKAFELGEQAISLPELEAVAFYLDTPIERFWARETAGLGYNHRRVENLEQLLPLRHRMIGAIIRQARLEAGLSLETLANDTAIEPQRLEAFELGEQPVPLAELEALSGILGRSIREFQDQYGPVGVWNAQQRAMLNFLALPLDLQLFIAKPVNRPYLDLAVRLNDMSVEKLRAVAEGLLEITY